MDRSTALENGYCTYHLVIQNTLAELMMRRWISSKQSNSPSGSKLLRLRLLDPCWPLITKSCSSMVCLASVDYPLSQAISIQEHGQISSNWSWLTPARSRSPSSWISRQLPAAKQRAPPLSTSVIIRRVLINSIRKSASPSITIKPTPCHKYSKCASTHPSHRAMPNKCTGSTNLFTIAEITSWSLPNPRAPKNGIIRGSMHIPSRMKSVFQSLRVIPTSLKRPSSTCSHSAETNLHCSWKALSINSYWLTKMSPNRNGSWTRTHSTFRI